MRLVTLLVDAPGERDTIVGAYLTNEVDGWGKRTVRVVKANGDLENWYLFPYEYTVL